MSNDHTYILLFDGVCNLCNGIVRFIIKRDSKRKFRFAALKSAAGQDLLGRFGLSAKNFKSVILIKNGKYYEKSTAALLILNELRGLWKFVYALIIIPRPIRDFVYNIVAKTRYSIFGKHDTCMSPSPDLKDRFLA